MDRYVKKILICQKIVKEVHVSECFLLLTETFREELKLLWSTVSIKHIFKYEKLV